MAVITKVTAQKRPGRYNIFVAGRYAFSASEKTVAEFVLLKGKELSEEQIEKIKRFDADAKASDLAAHYLSYEPRTVYELLHYLNQHGISPAAANSAVQELASLGYLNDKEYVKLFLKNNLRVGKDGPRSLARKLSRKGISQELSEQALAQVPEKEWLAIGTRVIKSQRQQVGKISLRELKRKMQAKLLQHGFSSSVARAVIEEQDLSADEEQQRQALKRQGIKAYKRFHHFDERERRLKIKRYLFSHGFSSAEIDAFLDGEIVDLAELAEY